MEHVWATSTMKAASKQTKSKRKCAVGHHHNTYFMAGFLEGAACSPAMKFSIRSYVCSGFRSNKNPQNPAKRSKMHNTCPTYRPSHIHIFRLYSNKNAWDKTLDHYGVAANTRVIPYLVHRRCRFDMMTYEHRFYAMLCAYFAGLVRKTAGADWFVCMRAQRWPTKRDLRIHYPGNVETSGTAFIYGCSIRKKHAATKTVCVSFLYLLVPKDIYLFRNCVFMRSM